MTTATMTSKGQITLPAATRAKLRLVKGCKLDVSENPQGQIVLTPKPAKAGDIRNLRGILKYDGPPATLEEMKAAIEMTVVDRYARSVD